MNRINILRYEKYVYIIAILFTFSFSPSTFAHVRWFIADGTNPDIALPLDAISFTLAIATLSLFILAMMLTYRSPLPEKIKTRLTQPIVTSHPWMWYFLVLIINIYLAINLLLGEFLAPNLYLPPHLAIYGVIIQVAAIVLMAVSISLTGVAIALTSLALFVFFPFFIALDYLFEFFFVGIALVFIGPSINKNDYRLCQFWHKNKDQLRKVAVLSLRIGLGFQLLELGIHNKLMLPGMALEFINQNDYYNFFPQINLPQISNLHFVFFVGISETILGLILIFNFANRIIYTLLLAIFTTTFLLSGLEELVGHLPIFTIIFILLLESDNQKSYLPTKVKKSLIDTI